MEFFTFFSQLMSGYQEEEIQIEYAQGFNVTHDEKKPEIKNVTAIPKASEIKRPDTVWSGKDVAPLIPLGSVSRGLGMINMKNCETAFDPNEEFYNENQNILSESE
jgi:hypothetical protein